MEKIIVATDLSANSRAGIRFAIKTAEARNAELVFVYVYKVLRASFWTDEEYQAHIDRRGEVYQGELYQFIKGIYRTMRIDPPVALNVAVSHNLDAVEGIVDFAVRHNGAFIFTSTRGAGRVKKWFGTTASKLIQTSPIPIFCVPSAYKMKTVKSLLYASDMEQHEEELKRVVDFARALNARIEILHLHYHYEYLRNRSAFQESLNKKAGYTVQVHYKLRDVERSVLSQIKDAVNKAKPSILVFFTHQDRSFFERILLPGNAKEYVFETEIPILSFPKSS